MKKSILALAILAALSGTAAAQTNVTIYGVVDAGVSYRNDGAPGGSTVGVTSGQQSGSRLGFKGTEDLGGGMSAVFTLETGFNVDDGTFGQRDRASGNTRLFGRQAWVGLNTGFGGIKLGRQQTALYSALHQTDPFQINLAGNAQRVFGYGLYASDPLSRADNTLSYQLPTINGFTGNVSYSFGEQAGEMSERRSIGAGASYVNGPLNVQFAYHKADTAQLFAGDAAAGLFGATAADLRAAFVGATYDFGVAKAHAGFADNRIELLGTEEKSRNYMVGISAPVGRAGTVLASYIRNDMRDIDEGESDMFAIGYTYALSKRTNLYTSYSHTKNDDNVALNTADGNKFGNNVNIFNVGVRHLF